VRALAAGLRFVVRDRHDVIAYGGWLAVTIGVWGEFGRSWACIAAGGILLALTWKGLR
jgi:hypothetical protein